MQTAAGVAAGEMMFQGMEDLFHGFGGHGGEFGRGFDGGGGGGETVINNYYDGDRRGAIETRAIVRGTIAAADDRLLQPRPNDASRNDSGNDLDRAECRLLESFGGNDGLRRTTPVPNVSFDNSGNDDDFDSGATMTPVSTTAPSDR